ncbi:hypothetical protein HID58_045757 [Brassica napus]|uniref:Uncharacterized protein n=1 Tax=Brassica napus TaxID=3708 RepID=A0ABQ8AUL1_BRANA|nr:hypothetical protein HID58_045757 [Brassica napus]
MMDKPNRERSPIQKGKNRRPKQWAITRKNLWAVNPKEKPLGKKTSSFHHMIDFPASVKTRDRSLPPVPERRHDGASPSAKHKRRRIRSTERLSTPTSRGSNASMKLQTTSIKPKPLRFLHEHRSSLMMEEEPEDENHLNQGKESKIKG